MMTMYTSDRAAAQEIPEFDPDEGDRLPLTVKCREWKRSK